MLLIDDMQFLTGHRETQTELLRIFNALQADGRQIVMTSDRPPAEIADVDERLITRLSGGLIVDMGAPDYETRMAILKAKCEERGVRFRAGVIEEVGRIEFKNVRELQGALNRLIAYQTLGGEQVDRRPRCSGCSAISPTSARASTPPRVGGRVSEFPLGHLASPSRSTSSSGRRVSPRRSTYWNERRLSHRRARPRAARRRRRRRASRRFSAEFEATRDAGCATSSSRSSRLDARARARTTRFTTRIASPEAEQLLERALRTSSPPPGPSAAFTRAGFEVGGSNQLAVRAADAIVARAGQPLQSAVHSRSERRREDASAQRHRQRTDRGDRRREASVACVPAQLFVDELIAALQEGTVDRWRARYRDASALLLDDVQFVAGKERTQEELFHVFNALYAEGKQLVHRERSPAARALRARGAVAVALRGRARRARCSRRIVRCANACLRDSSRISASSRRRDARRTSPSGRWPAFARSSASRIESSRRRRWRRCR